MNKSARLIIPVWGDVYAGKLAAITLPAILAPGNLPALCETFDVELVIVTESRLFDRIRSAPSFQMAAKLCAVKFIPLDDLMTDIPGDYGVVLTFALFRGFADLGARMTETFLLFLNADFIISDGSLRHLGRLMNDGKRVIHAPSFRVVLEDVWPQLQAALEPSTCTLRMPSRPMVRMALTHKHQTVKARIVNQRLYHQSWMDQYYWYVDENTLIGYQWPVALVAIKPERVVSDPVLVWDYGFVPEAAPTAPRHFIGDSDDFFMIELQSRGTGEEMIRPGWISFDDIARNLSMWTTKEQRECGRQLLTIHAADLPGDVEVIAEQSRAYMAQIFDRLSPTPQPHVNHGYLGPWFAGAKERIKSGPRRPSSAAAEPSAKPLPAGASGALRTIYRKTFGAPPDVGRFHPLWMDTWRVRQTLRQWREAGQRKILWISSRDSLFHHLLGERVDPSSLLVPGVGSGTVAGAPYTKAPYDACFCELTLGELPKLDRLYAAIRPLIRDGGHIVINAVKRENGSETAAAVPDQAIFPDVDVSEIHFLGTGMTAALRRVYLRTSLSFSNRPIARELAVSAVLMLIAPAVWLANARAARRDSTIFTRRWTSLLIEFTVRRARA